LWIFLTEILPASTRCLSILWRVDNTAALAHIRKEGGLRGRDLLEEAKKILLLHQHQLRILPASISSEENVQADAASRFRLVPDWHLDPSIFHRISSLWGPPQIDLFASLQSAQTTRFMTWRAADSPEAIDALSMGWDFALAYLFPPIPLLKRVVRKLELSRGVLSPCHSVLVGPDVVRQSPGASSIERPSSPLPRRPRHRPIDGGASSISGAALPSRLEDLQGSWGVDAVSDRSFRLIAAGWQRSSED
jgi:hypothetical protein